MPEANSSHQERFWREAAVTFKLGWPIVGAQLLWLSMVFVDNLLVARLGSTSLAALAMASGLYGVFNIVMIGSCSAAASIISAELAKENFERVALVAKQAVVIATGVVALMILAFCFSDRILVFLGQNPELTPIAQRYLLALVPGLFFNGLYVALRQIVEGHHDTRPSLVIAGCAACLNLVLDHLLIFGWGPVPALGIEGAGYATAIVTTFMSMAFLFYINMRVRYRHIRLLNLTGYLHLDEARAVLQVGLPMTGAMLAEMAFFVSATLVVGTLGEQYLAAHQIALNAASFTFMVPLGLSFAVSIRVAHYYGLKDHQGIKLAAAVGGCIAVGIAAALSAIFLIFPEFIAGWYTSDPVMIDRARMLLLAAGIFQIFDCTQVTGMGILRGLQQGRAALMNTVISFWCFGFPIGFWCSDLDRFGALGVWMGLVAGLAAASMCHVVKIVSAFKGQKDPAP